MLKSTKRASIIFLLGLKILCPGLARSQEETSAVSDDPKPLRTEIQTEARFDEDYITRLDLRRSQSKDTDIRIKDDAKRVLDFLWYYPEGGKAKGRNIFETFEANYEKRLNRDFFTYRFWYQDVIANPDLDDFSRDLYNTLDNNALGVAAANSGLDALILHNRLARAIDHGIRTIRDAFTVTYSLDHLRLSASGSLADDYLPLAEIRLSGIPFLRKIEYDQSFHYSRILFKGSNFYLSLERERKDSGRVERQINFMYQLDF
jgi:hypothetical protein